MSGIDSPVKDILAKVVTSSIKYCRVWNNQFKYIEEKKIEAFSFPCAFVEVIMPNNYNQLGCGITQSDVTFRIHIGAVEFDAGDGTMEQNLSIFALRDEIIALLTNFQPTACSNLMHTGDGQDFEHTDIYHYTIDFICSFIDDKGDSRKKLISKAPPTALEVDITIEDNI